MLRREALNVLAVEEVGAYSLLRVTRGGLDAGSPGQFFMLAAPKRVLPRPMSVCAAPPGELWFLIDAIGPGTRALCALQPRDTMRVLGPLGNGFSLDVARPLLVGGGIGMAPLPYLSETARAAAGGARLSGANATPRQRRWSRTPRSRSSRRS